MQVLDSNPGVFALLRHAQDGENDMLCVVNVTPRETGFPVSPKMFVGGETCLHDLLRGKRYPAGRPFSILMEPYQALWLVMETVHSADGQAGFEGYGGDK
jgi:hypothetical protein